MTITAKWRQHIEAWQRIGLSQAESIAPDAHTFTARLSDYRKLFQLDSTVLIPVQIQPQPAVTEAIVFTHAQGHRLELPASTPASWVAELLRCLA
ncbi:IS66 family insertion sequence element accessory protein TnpB [Methylomicrobium sp. Wu6]|uniref:IS66 family insertion sequence element accessory protein TnpB n=1 Tax=Methylomicrobium sp. Wu6 TaxID=3107928 RepID=UPI002DD6811E|nr:IS66 family insertion sequence element accessory protein TnpB [Methylomicrobium sp. Wu6]MEC4747181.1 IS66 family insertion sequence element accessory protein TnpB [Methylomicrobium sp. Wu6]